MRRIIILTMIAVTGIAAANAAQASNFSKIAPPPAGVSSISAVGIAAPERRHDLDLGSLRTEEAKLPGGITSRSDRMRLRAKRAEERRVAMDEAKRKKEAEKAK